MTLFRGFLVGACALGVFGGSAATAAAQTTIYREAAPRGWLGISSASEPGAAGARPLVRIASVVDGSPAERAGLRAGDLVLSVNGINASEALIQSLAFSLAPGESVNLRIQRGDAQHDVTVVSGERPASAGVVRGREVITINTDSVRGLARVWLDSARVSLDNLRLPHIIFDMPRIRHAGDTVHFNVPGAPFIRIDTIADGQVRILMRSDTLLRAEMDSVVRRLGSANFIARDSAFTWVRSLPSSFEGVSFFSMRSIAGAEMVGLDPDMAGYFGTGDGVLVVRVGAETPAAQGGMRAGDVIIGVNDQPVRSVEDVRRLVAANPPGTPIRLELMRDRRALRIEVGRL